MGPDHGMFQAMRGPRGGRGAFPPGVFPGRADRDAMRGAPPGARYDPIGPMGVGGPGLGGPGIGNVPPGLGLPGHPEPRWRRPRELYVVMSPCIRLRASCIILPIVPIVLTSLLPPAALARSSDVCPCRFVMRCVSVASPDPDLEPMPGNEDDDAPPDIYY